MGRRGTRKSKIATHQFEYIPTLLLGIFFSPRVLSLRRIWIHAPRINRIHAHIETITATEAA